MNSIKKILSLLIVLILPMMLFSCETKEKESSTNNISSSIEKTAVVDDTLSNNEEEKETEEDKTNVTGELKVHFIDVGQADCILVQQGNENMLIDAGNNEDEETIKNYLQSVGVNEFKYIIGTHPHEDHIGSMDYIINSFKVGNIYFPQATATTKAFENLVTAVKNKGMQFTNPVVGDTFNIGEAKCTILAPNGTTYEDLNNYSIVIKLEFGNNSFLFTGDAEDISEKEMMSKGLNLKADVLKVGHHGSDSSSTREFLNTVNPKYAVISVGKENDYGHPKLDTLQKLHAKGIDTYRTDESGTIIATSDGNTIIFNTAPSTSNAPGIEKKTESSEAKAQDDKKEAAATTESNSADTVWVASDKAKVYHNDKTCSGMKNPTQYSLKDAEAKGLRPCKKCAN